MFKPFFTFALGLFFTASVFAAGTPAQFIAKTDALLKANVKNGRIDYTGLKGSADLGALITDIAETNLSTLEGDDRKAFLINAYNLLVINQALENYPLQSVLKVSGFFDGNKQNVGGRKLTLNQLEKDLLLKEFPDARLHFVLVCGALGCPPITNFAYQPAKLEAQLNKQTKLALDDPTFIRVNGGNAGLSKIFEWYAKDFGGSKANVLGFINKYRTEAISADAKVSYYEYDWSLNNTAGRAGAEVKMEKMKAIEAMEKEAVASADNPAARGKEDMNQGKEVMLASESIGATTGGGNNAARYVVSSTIRKGTFEIKIFNNLYSQEAAGERSSFFTTSTSVLFGATDRVNVGFDLRYRRVRYDEAGAASNFDVLGSGGTFSRTAISGFGPKVRIAPFNNLPNFSIQSALWIPLADNLEGSEGGRFTDWDSPTWFTQVFNDFSIGNNFSVFTEIDLVLEDFGSNENGSINRFSTPVTGILSYFPNPKTTLYGLASYSPFWQESYDYFYQLGVGAKYQFTPKFELELLATAFDNQFLSSVNGNAGTVNLGLRFNL
ncbi:DUF547 domain-containing protein [Neolewinella persica]|uniref:DUF547 domain-containing protein n=1 Tax=Neolewinella persica TaxID=70998 RepID=UPI000371679A|nr:DUF547 domain-containing protein [Neolewinella persica]